MPVFADEARDDHGRWTSGGGDDADKPYILQVKGGTLPEAVFNPKGKGNDKLIMASDKGFMPAYADVAKNGAWNKASQELYHAATALVDSVCEGDMDVNEASTHAEKFIAHAEIVFNSLVDRFEAVGEHHITERHGDEADEHGDKEHMTSAVDEAKETILGAIDNMRDVFNELDQEGQDDDDEETWEEKRDRYHEKVADASVGVDDAVKEVTDSLSYGVSNYSDSIQEDSDAKQKEQEDEADGKADELNDEDTYPRGDEWDEDVEKDRDEDAASANEDLEANDNPYRIYRDADNNFVRAYAEDVDDAREAADEERKANHAITLIAVDAMGSPVTFSEAPPVVHPPSKHKNQPGFPHAFNEDVVIHRVSLSVLPQHLTGANCSNCGWSGFRHGPTTCANPLVKQQPIDKNMHCSLWTPDFIQAATLPPAPGRVSFSIQKRVDLTVLPSGIAGAACGNCKHAARFDDGVVCSHPDVGIPVANAMHCSRWDHAGIERPWGEVDSTGVRRSQTARFATYEPGDWLTVAGKPVKVNLSGVVIAGAALFGKRASDLARKTYFAATMDVGPTLMGTGVLASATRQPGAIRIVLKSEARLLPFAPLLEEAKLAGQVDVGLFVGARADALFHEDMLLIVHKNAIV